MNEFFISRLASSHLLAKPWFMIRFHPVFQFSFLALVLSATFVLGKTPPKKVAAIVTEYRHNSHADVIVGRILQTHTLDDKGESPNLKLVSLYIDQFPEKDTGRKWSEKYGVPIYNTIRDALTLGGENLAVDGVMLVAEHGDYPENEYGSKLFPKDRFFQETEKVFRQSGRSVPVFVDKHLSTNWDEAHRAYEVSRELNFPIVAGSSLPLTWRYPAIDLTPGAKVEEILVTTYGHPVSYGFHALEILQCLAEKRQGGETGIRKVQCFVGEDVWDAGKAGLFDRQLLEAAMAKGRHKSSQFGKRPLEQLIRKPYLYHVEYKDGLKGNVISTQNAVWEWCAAWKESCGDEEGPIRSTLYWTQENRPYFHFSFLTQGIEDTFHSGRSTWPVERTLLTTGMLDALLQSKTMDGQPIKTPYLEIPYRSNYQWKVPPPPPPERPWNQQ